MPSDFDISRIDRAFLEDPFPVYRALRETDPVHRNDDGSYFLTRHADLETAYKHPAMSSDKKVDFKPNLGDGPLYTHHTTSLVFNDDPYHARVRKLLAASGSMDGSSHRDARPEPASVADPLDRQTSAGERVLAGSGEADASGLGAAVSHWANSFFRMS